MAWGGGTGRGAVRRSRERNRNWLMQDRELVNCSNSTEKLRSIPTSVLALLCNLGLHLTSPSLSIFICKVGLTDPPRRIV